MESPLFGPRSRPCYVEVANYEPPTNSKQVLSRRSTRRTNPLFGTPDALFSNEADSTQKTHKRTVSGREDIAKVVAAPSFSDVYEALDSIEIPINESRQNVSADCPAWGRWLTTESRSGRSS
jgi:hypothetical protein